MLNSKILFSITLIMAFASGHGGDVAISKAASPKPTQMITPDRVPTYSYEVIHAYPHDSEAFTQGLVFYQGGLYESTGLNGSSSIRQVEIETGKVLKKVNVDDAYFAEGLALLNGRLYQLTWQTQKGFVYDLNLSRVPPDFSYTGEGWGLTHDSHSLIMSDGTSHIRFLNPDTFEVKRTITVRDNERDITQINELEYIKGEIYANIWLTDRIARIDPQSGNVNSWINLTGLTPPEVQPNSGAVLNGIAYDEVSDRLFVTGKLWPKLFEIKVKPRRNEIRRQ